MRLPARALAAILAIPVLHARPAGAAEFSGSATTIVRAFDLLHVELRENDQPIQRAISFRPIDQSVRLSWSEVGRRAAWSFDVALRGRTDLASGKGDPELRGWQADDLDVLLATARWRSEHGLVGLTLGRQNAITSFGWHAFDGVRLDLPKSKRIRAFVQAGLPVDLFDGGAPDDDGVTYGAGLTGIFPKHGSIGVDYEIRKEHADVLSEAAGVDFALQAGKVRIEASGDYSLLHDEFGEATVILGGLFARKHDFELRHSRIRPIFDTDSIFSSWELNPYDETRLQYEFRGDGPLVLGGYVSIEDYVKDAPLDPGEPPVEPLDPSDLPDDIKRAAVTARWETRREGIHRSEIGWQRGWTGGRIAAVHDSDWAISPRWRVGAGASIHRYENRYRLTEADETFTVRGRVRHDHDGKWDLALEVEQFFGRDRDTMRATLVFGTRFGKARERQPWWGGRWNWSRPTRAAAAGGTKGVK